ncbi:MAG: hypothetical protein ACKOGH_02965 [Alphaproteobacteria bacterium]
MEQFFESGRIVDAILALIVLQFAGLAWLRRRHGIGPSPRELLPTLAAGSALLLALRAALVAAHWTWVAVWLALALVAHLADIHRRWPRD